MARASCVPNIDNFTRGAREYLLRQGRSMERILKNNAYGYNFAKIHI